MTKYLAKSKGAMLGIAGIAMASLLAKTDKGVVSLVQNLLPTQTQKECVRGGWDHKKSGFRYGGRHPRTAHHAAGTSASAIVHSGNHRSDHRLGRAYTSGEFDIEVVHSAGSGVQSSSGLT